MNFLWGDLTGQLEWGQPSLLCTSLFLSLSLFSPSSEMRNGFLLELALFAGSILCREVVITELRARWRQKCWCLLMCCAISSWVENLINTWSLDFSRGKRVWPWIYCSQLHSGGTQLTPAGLDQGKGMTARVSGHISPAVGWLIYFLASFPWAVCTSPVVLLTLRFLQLLSKAGKEKSSTIIYFSRQLLALKECWT